MKVTNQILLLIAVLTSIRCISQDTETKNLLTPEQLDQKPYFFSLEEALENPDSVYRLGLTDEGLTEFPKEIFQFKNLQQLVISSNEISVIPERIRELSMLQQFSIGNNKLEKLPQGLFELKHLTTLVIAFNIIKELPDEIGNLKVLDFLNVKNNHIEVIPSSIGELSKLKELILAANPIQTLPPEIGKLTSLEELNVSGFQIGNDVAKYTSNKNAYLQQVPNEIVELAQLKILNPKTE